MKLFFYYLLHSVKNQIKKLFKTWIIILIAACLLFGIVVGVVVATLTGDDPSDTPSDPSSSEVGSDTGEEEPVELTEEERDAVFELVIFGVSILVMTMMILFADKSGSSIFLPADVTLLFPSPLKAQSVLFFRLMMQIGAQIFVTLYLLFDIPLIMETAEIAGLTVIMVLLAWFLLLAISKFVQVFLYAHCSTHPERKKYILPVTLGVLGVTALAFAVYYKTSSLGVLEALTNFFNPKWTRFIPVVGWLKGMVLFTKEGNLLAALGLLALLVAFAVGMVVLIYRSKADFYEDAMAKTEETARLLADAADGRTAIQRGKKDRSEKLRRDGFRYGAGASVFFHKTIYNRARFSKLGVLTKTSIVYIAVAVIFAGVLKDGVNGAAIAIAAIAFFRSLADPLAADMSTVYFSLLPENTWSKMFWSILGGSASTFLDVLPAMIVAAILSKGSFLAAIAWIGFIITLDLYSSVTVSFIDRSVPDHIGKNFKQVVEILFIYFGLLPDVVLIGLGMNWGLLALFTLFAACVNLLVAGIFFAVTPLLIERGR